MCAIFIAVAEQRAEPACTDGGVWSKTVALYDVNAAQQAFVVSETTHKIKRTSHPHTKCDRGMSGCGDNWIFGSVGCKNDSGSCSASKTV